MVGNVREDQSRGSEDFALSLLGSIALGGLVVSFIFYMLGQKVGAVWLAVASTFLIAVAFGLLFLIRNCGTKNTVRTYRQPDTNTHSSNSGRQLQESVPGCGHRPNSNRPPPQYRASWGDAYSENARIIETSNKMDGNFEEPQGHLDGVKSSSETTTRNFPSFLPKNDVSKMQSTGRQSAPPAVFVPPVNDKAENYVGQVTDEAWQCPAFGSIPTNPTLEIGTHGRNAPKSLSSSRLGRSTFHGRTEGRFVHANTLNDGGISVSAPSSSSTASSCFPQHVGLDPNDGLPSYEEATMLRAGALQHSANLNSEIDSCSSDPVQPALDLQSDRASVHKLFTNRESAKYEQNLNSVLLLKN